MVSPSSTGDLKESSASFVPPKELEDMYRGHKVVAFPARGRLSVRDVVANSSPDGRPRPRSLSAGRSRSRPADIVQDVYDRMGVNYKRGESSLDANKDDKAKTAAEVNKNHHFTARPVEVRGRQLEKSEEKERPRSLSRGRVASRWPPVQAKTNDSSAILAPSPKRAAPANNLSSSSLNSQNKLVISTVSPRGTFSSKEETESPPTTAETPTSIKDRINKYGGVKKEKKSTPRRNVDPQYAATFAVRDHPPKVDIYGSSRDRAEEEEEKKDDTIDISIKPTFRKPDTCDAKALPLPMRKNNNNAQSGNLANSYLATVQPGKSTAAKKKVVSPVAATANKLSLPSAPFVEINTSSDDVQQDANSVALSSISAEDFNQRSNGRETKKLSWQERNRLSAYNGQQTIPKTILANDPMIEKMVEERVQAAVSAMEARMEVQMQQFIQRMEEQVATRLKALDAKMESTTTPK